MKKLIALTLVLIIACASTLTLSAANKNTTNETVEALYFSKAPTFDGKITAAEWGEPTVKVDRNYKTAYQVDNGSGDITMDIYLRWDAEYFYVGITSPDKDGQSLQTGEGNTWNGDVIQFRMDPKGPNSNGNKDAPWDNNLHRNMALGLLSSDKKETTWNFHGEAAAAGKPIEGAKFKFGDDNGIFTWEIAIPHSFVGGKGEADFLYGIAIVRLNAPTGGTYNGWLTWGDGVCGPQDNDERCGANGVKLSKTEAVIVETKAPTTSTGGTSTGAAQTSDVEYVMFAALAMISVLGAFWLTRKAKNSK